MLLRRPLFALALALASGFALPAAADPANASSEARRTAQEARADHDDPLAAERGIFPRPRVLRGHVAFWRKVFAEYSRHQSVIHDIRKPERVYQVLDFRDSVASAGNQLNRLKDAEENAAKARIAELLRQTAELADRPDEMSDDQRRLAALFAEDPVGLQTAAQFIRTQRGLREQTAEAMRVSGAYLPEMERIFEQKGLPLLLTRLPIVESSFNVNAYSKVAAAGMWQFMPSTAKMYMRHNHIADDRKDPWRSTRAAADHLADDYRVLRDWPLAVTAYNFGRGGLVKGLKDVGGNGLEDLIERWDNPRFGFASRNFYAEFLAATDVERDWRKHFDGVERKPAMRFDEVQLTRYVAWGTLVRLSGGDEAAFKRLNPAYREAVTGGKLYVPAGDVIRVPAGEGLGFEAALSNLGPNQTFSRQREQFFSVKVRKGETLSAIAKRYGVSESTLKRVNGLKKGRVKAGQRLSIPNQGDESIEAMHAAAASMPEPVEAPVQEPARSQALPELPNCKGLKGKKKTRCEDKRTEVKAERKRIEKANAKATAKTRSDDGEDAVPKACAKLSGKNKKACIEKAQQADEAPKKADCKKLKGKKKAACEREAEQDDASSKKKKGKKSDESAEKKGKKSKAAPAPHKVKSGETLSEIAEKHGTTVKALMRLNGLKKPTSIRAGQKLKVQ